jgi:hypothetical protein
MTMADNSTINGTSSPQHDHDTLANRNDPKKRKRKRLSAVLDKLHNNTNIMLNQNTGSSKNYENLVNTSINNLSTSPNENRNVKMEFNHSSLARSVQENAEILRNLFALSQGLPSYPAFPAPFIMIPQTSPSYECNNNNNKNINNENFASDKLLNGKKMVKMEVKEETIDEEDANCSTSVRDTKTPLQEFLHLPKTIYNNQSLYEYQTNRQQHQQSLYQNANLFNNNVIIEPQQYPLDLSIKNLKRRNSSCSSSSPSLTKQLLIQNTEQKINAVLKPLGIQGNYF